MVLRRVNSIHTNDVGEYLLQIRDVPRTRCGICKRIRIACTRTGAAVWRVVLLVRNAFEKA